MSLATEARSAKVAALAKLRRDKEIVMKSLVLTTLVAALVIGTASLGAHHSFQAEYDQTKPLKLTGKITRVLVENPHGWIYLDAKNDDCLLYTSDAADERSS